MDNLRELFKRLTDEYADELAEAKKTGNYSRPIGSLVKDDIVKIIQKNVEQDIYTVEGSVGKGLMTNVPWIAVFDQRQKFAEWIFGSFSGLVGASQIHFCVLIVDKSKSSVYVFQYS